MCTRPRQQQQYRGSRNVNSIQEAYYDDAAQPTFNEENIAPQYYNNSNYNGEPQVQHSNFRYNNNPYVEGINAPQNVYGNNGMGTQVQQSDFMHNITYRRDDGNEPQYVNLDYIGNDQVKQSDFGSQEIVCNFDIFTKIKSQNDAFLTTVDIDGVKCEMEIDTGSKYSLMGEEKFKQLFPRRDLHPTNIGLRTYSGEKLIPRGFRQMNVTIREKYWPLRLYILPNNGSMLLGRD